MNKKLIRDDDDPEGSFLNGEFVGGGADEGFFGFVTNARKTNQIVFPCIFVLGVLVFVLFGLISGVSRTEEYNSYYSQTHQSTFVITSENPVIPNIAVSLTTNMNSTNDIVVQAGGGTSVYLNVFPEIESVMLCPKYISMSAFYGDKFLVSFSNVNNSTSSTLQVLTSSRSTPQKLISADTFYTQFSIFKQVALNGTSGLFVMITEDFSNITSTAVVIAGRLLSDSRIVYGTPVVYNPATYSITPDVSRLDSTSFAIVYYNDTNVLTRVGKVDPITLQISISRPLFVTKNPDYSVTYVVSGLSSSQFLVSYSSNSYISHPGMGNIYSALVVCNPSDWPDLILVNVSNLMTAASVGYLRGAHIDESSAFIAYIDANIDFGLRGTIVNVISGPNGAKVVYGASYIFSSGYTIAQDPYGLFMDFDVEVFSITWDEKVIMLLFADASNDAKMTITAAKLTRTRQLVEFFKKVAMGSPFVFNFNSYAWGAISSRPESGMQSGVASVALVTAFTDNTCTGTTSVSSLNFVDIKPPPIGVVTTIDDRYCYVSLWGSEVFFPILGMLEVGNWYFTDSTGKIFSGSISSGNDETYVISPDQSTIVITEQSKIAKAIKTDTILLQIS